MGISWSIDNDGWDGGIRRRARLTGSFDTSYTAGGESLTPADAGMDSIESVVIASGATESGYVPRYDSANDNVLLFEETDSTSAPLGEVADTTDVSSESVELIVEGRS